MKISELDIARSSVFCLSGGMDSTCLMLKLLTHALPHDGDGPGEVVAVSYNYGQKHSVELQRASANIRYISDMLGDRCKLTHHIVDITSIMSLYHSALTTDGVEVPEGFYEEDNMKATVVPNRNAIFASMGWGLALSLAVERDKRFNFAMGVHSGDHAIYPDCRPVFHNKLRRSFEEGNWDSELVCYYTPYMDGDKVTILKDALASCEMLRLNFDTVLQNTNTSYNPDSEGRSSGKSGADVERILAFHVLGRKDPVPYVDGWEKSLEFALNAEKEFRTKA